jgi:hypothetical protein
MIVEFDAAWREIPYFYWPERYLVRRGWRIASLFAGAGKKHPSTPCD